jgi:hypothetical protein
VLIVDLFALTQRDPYGIHKVIWDEIVEEDFTCRGRVTRPLDDGLRMRLAGCFDEMAEEFRPQLEAAARPLRRAIRPDAGELARHVVTAIEGAIMQARTLGDANLLPRQFALLKEHLRINLRA